MLPHDIRFALRRLLRAPGFSATALLVCWLPARRAAATDPIEALRDE